MSVPEALDAIAAGRITNSVAQLAVLQVSNVLAAEAAGRPVRTRLVDAPRLLVDRRDAADDTDA